MMKATDSRFQTRGGAERLRPFFSPPKSDGSADLPMPDLYPWRIRRECCGGSPGTSRTFQAMEFPQVSIAPPGAARQAGTDGDHSSVDNTSLRIRLTPLRRRLRSSRRSLDAPVGLVFRRGLAGKAAFRIIPTRRSLASWRFRSRVRNRRASIISTPSPVIRFPAERTRRARTSSGSDREFRTSNRSWTAVATLLMFCPPGPEDRMNRS